MTIENRFPDELEIGEFRAVDAPGRLYELHHERGTLGGRLVLIRELGTEYDGQRLLDADVGELEERFYDDETPNRWNIRLFWAYDPEAPPDQEVRHELESDTRYAIRRCVPVDQVAEFVAPLQTSQAKLDTITTQFDRGELIENVIEQNLGFLFGDATREEKFDRLKSGELQNGPSTREQDPDDPLDGFVDTVQLGEFRPTAAVDEVEWDRFTLLYGRNGTGKTSLLDATAYGLVGQIRHDDGRAADYDGLEVTLEGHSDPLSTDASDVHERIADWFGFRPYGRQNKHIEFYRVNYHEAGAATRFIETDPDIDIDQTLRRLLFGEELEDARKEKAKLLPRLREEIADNVDEIHDLALKDRAIHRREQKAQTVFSWVEKARQDLSPATAAAISEKQERQPDPDRFERWTTWERRIEELEAGLDVAPDALSDPDTAAELRDQLTEAMHSLRTQHDHIEASVLPQLKRARLTDLRDWYESDLADRTSASAGFIGLLLSVNQIDPEKLALLRRIVREEISVVPAPEETSSIGEWREAVETKLNRQLTALNDRKEKIEELTELEERRRELRAEIRTQTEEYLQITDAASHCPACYLEQSREEILTREKPDDLRETEADGVPDGLRRRISDLEAAIEFVRSPRWEGVEYDTSVRYDDLCGVASFQELWDVERRIENGLIFSDVSEETVDAFATALREHTDSAPDEVSITTAIQSGIDGIEAKIATELAEVPEATSSDVDLRALKRQYRDRIDDVDAARQVLRESYPDRAMDQPIDISNDGRVVRRAVERIEQNPDVLTVPDDYQNQRQEIQRDIERLVEEIDNCRDGIARLEAAFEGEGGEGELEQLVADHMTVVSTLFKTFQRPYEFEEVRYEEEVVVERRDGTTGSVSSMSSGQRAALALAIFVTNNLAHDRAPPVMMLDEPFAHLDDINTLSFFDVLLELVRNGDRQVLFATASEDVATLLERKIGDEQQFRRIDLPATPPVQ